MTIALTLEQAKAIGEYAEERNAPLVYIDVFSNGLAEVRIGADNYVVEPDGTEQEQ